MVGGKIDLHSHDTQHRVTDCKFKEKDESEEKGGAASVSEAPVNLGEMETERGFKDFTMSHISNLRKNISKGIGTAKKIMDAIWNEPEAADASQNTASLQNAEKNQINAMEEMGNPAGLISKTEKALPSNPHLDSKRQSADRTEDKKYAKTAGPAKVLLNKPEQSSAGSRERSGRLSDDTSYLLDSYNKTGEYSVLGKGDGNLKKSDARQQRYSRKA